MATAKFGLAALILGAALSASGRVDAADFTSTFVGSTGMWSDTANWTTLPATDPPVDRLPDNGVETFEAVIASGSVTTDLAATVDDLTLSGGSLVQGAMTIENGPGTEDDVIVPLNEAITVAVSGSWTSGIIKNGGGVIVDTGATFTLSGAGAKSLDDETTLTVNGTLTLDGSGRLQSIEDSANGVAINVGTGGVFDIVSNADIEGAFGSSPARKGTFTNDGTFQKSAGTGVTDIDGNWTFTNTTSGTVIVQTGTLDFENFGGNTNAFNNDGAADVQGGVLVFGNGTTTGTLGIAAGAAATVNTNISGKHTFDGAAITNAGTFAINGNVDFVNGSTYAGAGGVEIASGTVTSTDAFTFSDLTWSGGDIALTGGFTIATGGIAAINGSAEKELTDGVTMTIDGTATVTSSNNVDAVSVTGSEATVSISATGLLDIQSDVGLSDGQGGGNPASVAAKLDIAGEFKKSVGTGTTTVDEAWTVTNTGTIAAETGTLVFGGDVAQGGVVDIAEGAAVTFNGVVSGSGGFTGIGSATFASIYDPGDSPAEIDFGGDVTFTSDATLAIELGGTAAGTEFDLLDIEGTATLAGDFTVALIDSYVPATGDTFEVLNAGGGITGTFATLASTLPELTGDQFWDIAYAANTLTLSVMEPVTMIAGDFNLDGMVDGADYAVWRNSLNATGVGLAADANGDEVVDALDLDIWKANFGNVLPTPGAFSAVAATAAPEPSSAVLLLLAGWGFARVRRS